MDMSNAALQPMTCHCGTVRMYRPSDFTGRKIANWQCEHCAGRERAQTIAGPWLDVVEHVRLALIRGGSPYTVDDVFRALWRGQLRLIIGHKMSASAWVRAGVPEIVHIAGPWDDGDVADFCRAWEQLCRAAGRRGIWNGRRGWERFIQRRLAG
jgi:hypothetical protein